MDIKQFVEKYENPNKSYSLRYPTTFIKAEGIYMYDINGNKYIDCLNGFGVNILGHNHIVLKEAGKRFFEEQYPYQILDMSSTIRQKFIKKIFSFFPENMKDKYKIQFSGGSGSDAVESAMELAIKHTGRTTIFAFSGCFHGLTHGSMGLTGNVSDKYGSSIDIVHLPYPHAYRCPFGLGENGENAIIKYIENLLDDPKSGIKKPAAFIMELIQSDGGIIIAPKNFVLKIRELTQKRNILLIIDEVQTGFGKTGKMFAFEEYNIIPNIITFSKALGAGMPLSAVVYNNDMEISSHGTFRGNQIAMYLGLTMLEYIEKHNIIDNVKISEKILFDKLNMLKNKYIEIGEIRIKGLLFAIEFSKNSKEYDPEFTEKVFNECFKNKLLCKLGGRNNSTLIFWSYLLITELEINEIINILNISIYACL